ncbi:hypothetical protein KAS08_02635 [Candidatus Pacearchaeota archaeon]|nr:hypothetical protein [Candidatus Pacearchaeota archaeon]
MFNKNKISIFIFLIIISLNFSSAVSYDEGTYGSGLYGTEQVISETSSGGYPTFTPTQEQIIEGYEKSLYRKWKIRFEFDSESHIIKLDEVINRTAIITVSSKTITFNLTVNQTKKINLNDDEFFDLEIFLENIKGYKTNLIVKFMREEIFKEIDEQEIFKEIDEQEEETGKKQEEETGKSKWIFLIFVVFLIFLLIIIKTKVWKKKRKKRRKKKS